MKELFNLDAGLIPSLYDCMQTCALTGSVQVFLNSNSPLYKLMQVIFKYLQMHFLTPKGRDLGNMHIGACDIT